MQKKTAALLLLAALLFNSLGYTGLFLSARHRTQTRMQEAVAEVRSEHSDEDPSDLVEIVVPDGGRRARDVHVYGEELQYRGAMYDLVRVERSAHETRYYALRDEEDTAYFQGLAQSVNAHRADGAKQSDRVLPFLKRLYGTVSPLSTLEEPIRRLRSFPVERALRPAAPFLAVPVPPPWLG